MDINAGASDSRIDVLENDRLDLGDLDVLNSPQLRVESVVNVNTEGTCSVSQDGRSVEYSTRDPNFEGTTFCQYRAIVGNDQGTRSPLTTIRIEVSFGPTVSPSVSPTLAPNLSPSEW